MRRWLAQNVQIAIVHSPFVRCLPSWRTTISIYNARNAIDQCCGHRWLASNIHWLHLRDPCYRHHPKIPIYKLIINVSLSSGVFLLLPFWSVSTCCITSDEWINNAAADFFFFLYFQARWFNLIWFRFVLFVWKRFIWRIALPTWLSFSVCCGPSFAALSIYCHSSISNDVPVYSVCVCVCVSGVQSKA